MSLINIVIQYEIETECLKGRLSTRIGEAPSRILINIAPFTWNSSCHIETNRGPCGRFRGSRFRGYCKKSSVEQDRKALGQYRQDFFTLQAPPFNAVVTMTFPRITWILVFYIRWANWSILLMGTEYFCWKWQLEGFFSGSMKHFSSLHTVSVD